MKQIECHFTGRLGRDAESRTSRNGNPMAILNVIADTDEEGATWINVLCFKELATQVAELKKGERVYCKGTLKAELWQPENGEPRINLTLLANVVQPHELKKPAAKRKPAPKPAQPANYEPEFSDPVPF